jgi:hypothetical protein
MPLEVEAQHLLHFRTDCESRGPGSLDWLCDSRTRFTYCGTHQVSNDFTPKWPSRLDQRRRERPVMTDEDPTIDEYTVHAAKKM